MDERGGWSFGRRRLLEEVYQAQGKRRRHSRTRGRMQTPAEVALRLLILKHVRNWSYDELEREVRANLVYRAFTRIGDQKVRDWEMAHGC
jgi:transposase, IS5 family